MESSSPKIPGWIAAVGMIVGGIFAVLALFFLIQLIPFGRDHTNPPVVTEPKWDSPDTRALAKRACFDCHSNETVWPWYSNIAPISWMVAIDVADGRETLNFSDWTPIPGLRTEAISGTILEGDMPPGTYLIQHPDAVLTAEELKKLADGLTKSLAP